MNRKGSHTERGWGKCQEKKTRVGNGGKQKGDPKRRIA